MSTNGVSASSFPPTPTPSSSSSAGGGRSSSLFTRADEQRRDYLRHRLGLGEYVLVGHHDFKDSPSHQPVAIPPQTVGGGGDDKSRISASSSPAPHAISSPSHQSANPPTASPLCPPPVNAAAVVSGPSPPTYYRHSRQSSAVGLLVGGGGGVGSGVIVSSELHSAAGGGVTSRRNTPTKQYVPQQHQYSVASASTVPTSPPSSAVLPSPPPPPPLSPLMAAEEAELAVLDAKYKAFIQEGLERMQQQARLLHNAAHHQGGGGALGLASRIGQMKSVLARIGGNVIRGGGAVVGGGGDAGGYRRPVNAVKRVLLNNRLVQRLRGVGTNGDEGDTVGLLSAGSAARASSGGEDGVRRLPFSSSFSKASRNALLIVVTGSGLLCCLCVSEYSSGSSTLNAAPILVAASPGPTSPSSMADADALLLKEQERDLEGFVDAISLSSSLYSSSSPFPSPAARAHNTFIHLHTVYGVMGLLGGLTLQRRGLSGGGLLGPSSGSSSSSASVQLKLLLILFLIVLGVLGIGLSSYYSRRAGKMAAWEMRQKGTASSPTAAFLAILPHYCMCALDASVGGAALLFLLLNILLGGSGNTNGGVGLTPSAG